MANEPDSAHLFEERGSADGITVFAYPSRAAKRESVTGILAGSLIILPAVAVIHLMDGWADVMKIVSWPSLILLGLGLAGGFTLVGALRKVWQRQEIRVDGVEGSLSCQVRGPFRKSRGDRRLVDIKRIVVHRQGGPRESEITIVWIEFFQDDGWGLGWSYDRDAADRLAHRIADVTRARVHRVHDLSPTSR